MNELEMRRWADSHPIGEELFGLLDAANLKVSILVEQLAAAELRADALHALLGECRGIMLDATRAYDGAPRKETPEWVFHARAAVARIAELEGEGK